MKLRSYQEEGVSALLPILRERGAAILADEPGLGKTAQALNTAVQINCDRLLVVCPASLRSNWDAEAQNWLADTGIQTQIVSYGELALGRSEDYSCDMVVFDEAHYLKNPDAKRTKKSLNLQAKYRLFLTGTPIVNRPMDIYPILRSMGLKLSRVDYGKEFCDGKLVQISWQPKRFVWDFTGASNLDVLQSNILSRVMVRRRKSQVLTELPEKIRQVIIYSDSQAACFDVRTPELTKLAARLFDSLEAYVEDGTQTVDKVDFTTLSSERLKLAVNKLPTVLAQAELLLQEEDKLVIFAHHREVIELLSEGLSLYRPVTLQGGMTDGEKNKAVKDFQEGESRVFIGQIQTAGVGLTLTAASTVLFAELDWVPGNVTQAEDRVHRLGQKQPVRIFHVVFAGTIEERVVEALVRKQKIIEQAVDA